MEVRENFTKKKLCCVPYRRLFLLTFLFLFLIWSFFHVFRFQTPSTWTNKLLSEYFDRDTSLEPYFVEYPYKYNFIINEENRCKALRPFLVLIVPVAPQNIVDRQIIRRTWGQHKALLNQQVLLFFLLGLGAVDEKVLLAESEKNKDILQADFIDSYKNLTIKSMVMLEWLYTYCPNTIYAMKIDTDMFLNLPKLLEMLQNAPQKNYLTGFVMRQSKVLRDTTSKWFVPFYIFPGEVFPPYALGQGYILSMDLAKKLVDVASREKMAFFIEDVYLGMCMQRLGLQPTDPSIQKAFPHPSLNFDRCGYSKIIASVFPAFITKWDLWKKFTEPGPYCENKTVSD